MSRKKGLSAFLALLTAIILVMMFNRPVFNTPPAPLAGSAVLPEAEKTLTVYAACDRRICRIIISEFEKDTGIGVEVVTDRMTELLTRLDLEMEAPGADILWGGDESTLSLYNRNREAFMTYVSPEDGNMRQGFRNRQGFFSPVFARPVVILVNTKLAGDVKIEDFTDLLNPELKGMIALGDPEKSETAFRSLITMLYAAAPEGDPLSDEAWAFLTRLLENLDGRGLAELSGEQVYKGVADGEYAVALTWEAPAAVLERNGAPVKVVFPAGGTSLPGSSVQIVAGTRHPDQAKKFVDYLLSEKIQTLLGEKLMVRPLRQGAEPPEWMPRTEDIRLLPDWDEVWISENRPVVLEKYGRLAETVP